VTEIHTAKNIDLIQVYSKLARLFLVTEYNWHGFNMMAGKIENQNMLAKDTWLAIMKSCKG
jgi:hypothetical protein